MGRVSAVNIMENIQMPQSSEQLCSPVKKQALLNEPRYFLREDREGVEYGLRIRCIAHIGIDSSTSPMQLGSPHIQYRL